jgi:tetratricopeptide (TPR) repeat protein
MVGGHLDDAIEHFDAALGIQPDNIHARVYKACVLAEKRNLKAARILLETVLEEHPEDMEAARHHASVLAALGEDEAALAHFNAILKRNPNHVDSIARKAAIHLRRGNHGEAVKCLREQTALVPGDVHAWVMLLDTLSAMGARAAAVAAASQALEACGEIAEAYFYRGRALLEQNRTDQAIVDLRRAGELNDRMFEAHFLLAQALLNAGKLRQALSAAGRALQLNPDDRRALLVKATAYHRLGEHDAELRYLNTLLAGEPGDFRLVKMKADSLLACGRVAEARTAVEHFLARSPSHPLALLVCAELCERVEDTGAARRCFRRLLSERHSGTTAFLAYAGFLLRQSSPEPAVDVLNRAILEHPEDASIQTCRAAALQSLGRHTEVCANLGAFVAAGHATAEAYWLLGKSQYTLGCYSDALASFQGARRLDSRAGGAAPNFRCLVAEAYTLHRLDRTAEGIRLLERHFSSFKRFEREFHEVVGELYEFTGATAKALAVFSEGIRRYPDSPVLHYRLSRTAARVSRKQMALRHLADALELDATLADTAVEERAFRRYAFSPAFNRLLGYEPLRRRAGLIAAVAVAAAAVSFLLWRLGSM